MFVSSGLEMFDFHARFYDPQLGRWFVPHPAEQFANPYLAIANNPVMYTDPNGMFTNIFGYDEDGGGGGGDGDPGDGIELGWDGGYHGPLGDTEAYRLSNYFMRGSQNVNHYSWQNSLGAHDGDHAPFRSGGNTYYYKASRGGYGYWHDYATYSGNFFGSEDGSLVWMPILFPVSEWVGWQNAQNVPGGTWDSWGVGSVPYLGNRLGGTNFVGSGPIGDPRIYNLPYIDEIDAAAFFHDLAYFNEGASGVLAVRFNTDVAYADARLVNAAVSIMDRYYEKGIDQVIGLPISDRTFNIASAVYLLFAPIAIDKLHRLGDFHPNIEHPFR